MGSERSQSARKKAGLAKKRSLRNRKEESPWVKASSTHPDPKDTLGSLQTDDQPAKKRRSVWFPDKGEMSTSSYKFNKG